MFGFLQVYIKIIQTENLVFREVFALKFIGLPGAHVDHWPSLVFEVNHQEKVTCIVVGTRAPFLF